MNLLVSMWITIFGLLQNYLCGSTDVLGSSSKLQTLMLSSNFFGCDAVQLDNADHLATGNKRM